MFEKPLVGKRLGDALVDLYERMNDLRPDREWNEDDFLAYIDNQGYTDFRDCCDHALAVLRFAEKFEFRELWTDAFVHCAGMWEQLDMSAEFEVGNIRHPATSTSNDLCSIYLEPRKLSFPELILRWTYDLNEPGCH